MDALGILGSLLFVVYLVYWSLKNDKVRYIKDQVGFLRMRDPGTEQSSEAVDLERNDGEKIAAAVVESRRAAGRRSHNSIVSRVRKGSEKQ